ncbi:MAG: hypothetical protein P9M00_02100 [Candidatus Tritonobacter lacicola]|nr:hypothetical protein [Candidatus Tritonobacter lacicola]
MASTATLTSLAMLKVNIDQGSDYLEYLRPFILQVLIDHEPSPVTDQVVVQYLLSDFGLEIPPRSAQIILRRISRKHPLQKSKGVYHIKGELPNPNINIKKADADRHIDAVISGLFAFRQGAYSPISTRDEAVDALCAFLSEFSIPCIRAYLRGTAIPNLVGKQNAYIILVSQYIIHLRENDLERFDSMMILVQGHMLANALLCPDLHDAPKSYKRVIFYLDTPLLVQRLGLEGKAKHHAIEELIILLRNLGAKVATFNHSRDELERVVRGAANHIDYSNGRGAVVMESRRKGATKSDLLLVAGKIDDLLEDANIEVKSTPQYIIDFQIDENAFEKALDDEVSYFNPRAREYDINSVRSIYALRKGQSPSIIEKCKAVLVTSNSAFSKAAYEYGKKHEESYEVSTVITDFSLANMAWLKAPMGAPSLPTIEVIAYSYAALKPSKELLDKYLSEIDQLEKNGKISERDHQLLRSSVFAQDELMRLTLGEEAALTPEAITETLARVTKEIKKEEYEKFKEEQTAHGETQKKLRLTEIEKKALQQRLFWKYQRKAKYFAWAVSGIISVLLLAGVIFGYINMQSALGWVLLLCTSAFLAIMTLANLIFGTTVRRIHRHIEELCQKRFLKKESKAIGIDFGDWE